MSHIISIALGGLAVTYLFFRALLLFTQDAREPPAILTALPFVSPVVAMIRWKSRLHSHLRFVVHFLPIHSSCLRESPSVGLV